MAYAAAAGGIVQGFGTAYGAWMASEAAKEERKQKKNIWNKDTGLKIAQFNLNQNRLSGLASVLGGERSQNRAALRQASGGYGTDTYKKLRSGADAAAKNTYQGKGDYSTLKASDYQLGGSDSTGNDFKTTDGKGYTNTYDAQAAVDNSKAAPQASPVQQAANARQAQDKALVNALAQ